MNVYTPIPDRTDAQNVENDFVNNPIWRNIYGFMQMKSHIRVRIALAVFDNVQY